MVRQGAIFEKMPQHADFPVAGQWISPKRSLIDPARLVHVAQLSLRRRLSGEFVGS